MKKRVVIVSAAPEYTAVGNYLPQLLALGEQMDLTTPQDVTILHNEWCALLTQAAACDCDPIVRLGKPEAR